ncbi:hypothetical protein [Paenibacillus massiliensis]|uniref:hypothetical protein n=1 Tax=Paenibacillus massiliensis TaxID=225917 RepID=UPI000380B0F8|nr:hypothetical protein [Paenibacillus massiliensis]
MKRNAIVFAALALILSGTMLFPAVSSAAEGDTTTDPFGTNIESGAEISPTDETVTDEELYGDLDPELVQEYIEYMDYWDQLGQLDVYEDKGIDTFNNTPELTNATRKQIFLDRITQLSLITLNTYQDSNKSNRLIRSLPPFTKSLYAAHTFSLKV